MNLAESLIADIPKFGHDEQRALRELFNRVLDLGRQSYGEWIAARETRDMVRELRDEMIDGVWYAACDAVMRLDESVREQAALICAMCASGREFAVYVDEVVDHLGIDLDSPARWLAFDTVCRISNARMAKSGGPGWCREDYAEAEAELRTAVPK
jgi:hypothetical protein